jgi:hypothetical protein
LAQVGEGKQTRTVPILPKRLEGVTAYRVERLKLKAVGLERALGSFHRTQYVSLALAYGARAGAPEGFQREKRFLTVIPSDGKFPTDDIDAVWYDVCGGGHG